MKKTLLIALLVVAVLSSSFAARGSSTEIMLGLSSGFNQEVLFYENPLTEELENSTRNIIPLKVDGLFYLGDSFALNTALGMDIYLPETDNGDASVGLVADILAYYRMQLGDAFDLLAGGGVSYKYKNIADVDGGDIGSSSTSNHTLALLASLRFQFEATDHIVVFAGADLGYNVLNVASTTTDILGNSNTETKNLDRNIMPWAIKAGVSYKF